MSVVITEPALQSQAVPFSYLPPTGYSLINVKLPQPPSRVAFRWSLPSISPPFGSSGAVRPHFSPSASISVRRPVCLVPHLSVCGKPCWLWSMSHACFVISNLHHVSLSHLLCLLSPWHIFHVNTAGTVSFLSPGRDLKTLHSFNRLRETSI